MSSRDDGGQAFPGLDLIDTRDNSRMTHAGMTLRDYFAAQALTGLITLSATTEIVKHTPEGNLHITGREGFSKLAYEYADAMLAERAK